jgi:hypothetical protein
VGTRIFREINTPNGTKKVLSISYSQLSIFKQCNMRWVKYYLLGRGESEDTESTELGTQIHAAIETYCNKLHEGYEWSLGEVIDLVEHNLDERKIKFKPEDDDVIVKQHLDMAKALFIGDSGLGELLSRCDVLGQEIEFHLPFKLPFDVKYGDDVYNEVVINGFIDLLLKDKETGEIIVVDHKTSKKVFDDDKLYNDLQFPIYSLVVLNLYGRLPSECYYYFTRFNKLVKAPSLVYNDEDSVVVKYFTRGKNKGLPKYTIKSVGMVERELMNTFRCMYSPTKQSDYIYNKTALCSWCPFGLYGDNSCKGKQYPPYIRKDIPIPKAKLKSMRSAR